MKVRKGFNLRPLGDEYILIAESTEWVNLNSTISMNETAAFLWRSVCDGREFDAKSLSQLLLDEYEVSPETALHDAEATLASWKDIDIITE